MKAAIVGCGNIAAVHAACLQRVPGCSLTGFADNDRQKADAMAEKYNGHAYDSLEVMLEAEKPDVLHICTPHSLHVPMALCGLKHGAHVFMEKPPVISEEQLRELSQGAAAAADRRLGFCFQNRYNPGTRKVKELLGSGEAGKIRGARGILTWSRDEAYYTQSGWRGALSTEGGGALINQAVHTMDLLVCFLGKPLRVDAGMHNHHLKGIIEVEDTMEAYIRFADCGASFYATTAFCTDSVPLLEIVCDNMTIRLEEPDVTCIYQDGRKETLSAGWKEAMGKSYWGGGHRDCIAEFYRCIGTGERFFQDLDGVMDTIQLMLGTYESARSGRQIQMADGAGQFL